MSFYYGQRLSFGGALCTVRYYGLLNGAQGGWLGVEWDDATRGKHNGTYKGQAVFQCFSPSPTAASFIRPSRTPDRPRSFLEAVRFKYGGDQPAARADDSGKTFQVSDILTESSFEISGKAVEEVGFDRIRQQQAVLGNLKIVVVDGLCIAAPSEPTGSEPEIGNNPDEIAECCPNIIELDLGWNLFETLDAVANICRSLRKLRTLKLSGLRFRTLALSVATDDLSPFQNVEELHLNECLLTTGEVSDLVKQLKASFPSLKTLSLSSNNLATFPAPTSVETTHESTSATTLILENNVFTSLIHLPAIRAAFPNLTNLSLQGNSIANITTLTSQPTSPTYPQLQNLDLSRNKILSYTTIDALPSVFPDLTSLRVSSNPLYILPNQQTRSDSAYFLTLARIPTLQTLNYTNITPRDREEGEIYYLSVAEKDIVASFRPLTPDRLEAARAKYPRYEALCAVYDRESILSPSTDPDPKNQDSKLNYSPGSLGARLIQTTFHLPSKSQPRTIHIPLPHTLDVYRLKALLSRTFNLPPLQFRLIYESPDLDPVRDDINASTDWADWGDWDVDDDAHVEAAEEGGEKWVDGVLYKDGGKWRRREIEIVDGFREWGFLIEEGLREARVRIEVFEKGKGR